MYSCYAAVKLWNQTNVRTPSSAADIEEWCKRKRRKKNVLHFVTRPNRSRLLKPSETAPGFEAKLTQWPNHVNDANSHAAHRKAHILKAYNVKNAGFYWLSRHLHTCGKRFIHSDNFYKVHSEAVVPASVLANSYTRFLATWFSRENSIVCSLCGPRNVKAAWKFNPEFCCCLQVRSVRPGDGWGLSL